MHVIVTMNNRIDILSHCNFAKMVLMLCVITCHSCAFWNGRWFSYLTPTFDNFAVGMFADWLGSFQIPAFVLIIATFVTLVRMLLDKFIPDLYESMGVYLPLIVVNCIILGRAESFASKNPVADSALDGLFTGLGFTWAMTAISIIREVLGAGQLFGVTLWDFKIEFFTSSAGAFFVYGLCIALFNGAYTKIESKMRKKRFEKLYHAPMTAETVEAVAAAETIKEGK